MVFITPLWPPATLPLSEATSSVLHMEKIYRTKGHLEGAQPLAHISNEFTTDKSYSLHIFQQDHFWRMEERTTRRGRKEEDIPLRLILFEFRGALLVLVWRKTARLQLKWSRDTIVLSPGWLTASIRILALFLTLGRIPFALYEFTKMRLLSVGETGVCRLSV